MLENFSSTTTQLAMFTALALFSLGLSIYILVHKFLRNRLLEKHGVLSNAIVKRRRIVRGKYIDHKIDYEFEANGRRYECVNQHVYADTYSRLKEGDVVQFRYLADNPTQSKLAGNYDTSDYEWGCVSVVISLFITLVAVAINSFPRR